MSILKRFFIFSVIIPLCFLFGCGTYVKKGVTTNGEKVYLGVTPIEKTPAYENFLRSSKSEVDKLYYLLDRIRDSRSLIYIYEGDQYNWFEAYSTGVWVLWHHYRKGEDARSALRREVANYSGDEAVYIKFQNESIHLAYRILLNELDLLDETYKRNLSSTAASKK